MFTTGHKTRERGQRNAVSPSRAPATESGGRSARRRAALLAGAPASQRMQAEQFGRICGRALPFALCVGRARGLRVLAWRFSALVAWVAANNRVLVPPGLRRRRPPRRRAVVRVRGRAAAGHGVEVGRLPRPLAVSAPSVWSAWPLAALSRASARRAGAWPVRPFGAAAARLRPLAWPMAAALAVEWGRAGRSVSRRVVPLPPPRPRGAPPFPSSCSPAARTQAEILAGAGAQPPASFGRWPKSVARGARALPSPLSLRSASRPPAVRASLAAPCAPSAPCGARRPRRLVVRREW